SFTGNSSPSKFYLKYHNCPTGLIIEKWRWSVFSGKTKSLKYNTFWWNLHRRYMGVVPHLLRSEKFFDPAAKFHVHNIPSAGYSYFKESLNVPFGSTAFNLPLHKCDIYGSKNVGKFLRLEKGSTA
ncbi:angiotensin-converting enzyme-like, partial [Mycetomoellerius zeteki]|uniref:angiotensin-converting enzyme-like n=1 Tax=Mycetomoellerius zeteki TaxID=64791 RepID=UPI00084E743E